MVLFPLRIQYLSRKIFMRVDVSVCLLRIYSYLVSLLTADCLEGRTARLNLHYLSRLWLYYSKKTMSCCHSPKRKTKASRFQIPTLRLTEFILSRLLSSYSLYGEVILNYGSPFVENGAYFQSLIYYVQFWHLITWRRFVSPLTVKRSNKNSWVFFFEFVMSRP